MEPPWTGLMTTIRSTELDWGAYMWPERYMNPTDTFGISKGGVCVCVFILILHLFVAHPVLQFISRSHKQLQIHKDEEKSFLGLKMHPAAPCSGK